MSYFDDKDALARIQAATDYPLQRGDDGWVVGHFFESSLTSLFQPVFDLAERRVVGHAGHVRTEPSAPGGSTGAGTPLGLFALATDDPLLVRLDRLCRTLHALNYFDRAIGDQVLYLGVQARLLESVKDGHGRAFERVLDLFGVETSRVVIEIPPEVNADHRLFKHVTVNYRSRGYRIACTHSGRPDDWMVDLGSLYPDVVRLDAQGLREPGSRALIDVIHRFGGSVLVQEIEREEDVAAAVRSGADLVQGRYLAEPSRGVDNIGSRAASRLQHPGYAW
jgi:EAL domain-containing protein (putative c-di-GMP-specific phosphodiesterase class I)